MQRIHTIKILENSDNSVRKVKFENTKQTFEQIYHRVGKKFTVNKNGHIRFCNIHEIEKISYVKRFQKI